MQRIVVDDFEFRVMDNIAPKEDLISLYWNYHPRFRFFKTVPANSRLLDIGAGSGGLWYWKEWDRPKRGDIELYAVDMNKGKLFDKYEDYQICNLEREALKFENNYFDSILMSHVLEHISDEDKFLTELARVLNVNGKLYIEIPTPETLNYPRKDVFIKKGINVVVSSFIDDPTHLRTFTLEDLSVCLRRNGFEVLEAGIIQNRFLEDELFTLGMRENDPDLTTMAVWSKLRWAQYVICEKRGPKGSGA